MSDSTDFATEYGDANSDDEPNDDSDGLDLSFLEEPVGHVALRDSRLYVRREEMSVTAYVNQGNRDGLRVGNYTCIPYPEEQNEDVDIEVLLASIEGLEYRSTTEMDDWVEEGNLPDFGEHNMAYVAELDPIGIVEYEDRDQPPVRQSIDRPPKPNADVHLIEDEETLRVGLNIPSQGIYVGDLAVHGDYVPRPNNRLTYLLSNPNATDGTADEGEPAIWRHVLVAGSTGKGKTHFAKNILRQCAEGKEYPIQVPPEEQEEYGITDDVRDRALNICIIDPEDEYVELRNDNPNLSAEKARELEQRGIEVGGLGDYFEAFAPITGDSTPGVDDVRTFGIPFSIVEGRPQLLLSASPPDPTYIAIRDVLDAYFRQFNEDSNDEPTYRDFEQWLDLNGDNVVDNDNILAAVERRMTGPVYDRVFDHGTTSLEEYTAEMFRGGQTTVIPTGHLRGQTEKLVLLALMTHIVENKIESDVDYPDIKGQPLLLAVDEAHEYLGETDRPRERYLVRNFRRAAKRGRKDKFGLFMVTQNPQDVDDEVLQQTNTRIYLGLQPEVVEQIRVPSGFAGQIETFDQGQAVVDAPDVRPVEVLGLDVCMTEHSN